MTLSTINSGAGVTRPLGPFSRAVWAGDLLYVSGQTGVDPATEQLVKGGVIAETQQVLTNLKAVLGVAGLGFSDVVKANVFLTDMTDFAEMNDVYSQAFLEPKPARTTVAVSALPGGALVEIELIGLRQRAA